MPMKMEHTFDLIVIGTGSAGSIAAHKCREAGWSVAIFDSRPFGGTCALRGCSPKKVLVDAAEAVDWHNRMKLNVLVPKTKALLDWPRLIRFEKSFTDPVPENSAKAFKKAGIEMFGGRASFIDERTIDVDGKNLTGKYILIATGSKPTTLGMIGEDLVTTSDDFLKLRHLPKRILFIGGGYISFEFAHVAARAGTNVTILHRSAYPLKEFDQDLVRMLVDATEKAGITVLTDTEVSAVERAKGTLLVRMKEKNGARSTRKADLVVHGAGRVPDIDDLNLAASNIAFGEKGIEVNAYLQSASNPAVYSAGDSAASNAPMLSPVAGRQGNIAAENMLHGNVQKMFDPRTVPSVVYTIPPLASVGYTERSAEEENIQFRVVREDMSSWHTSRRIGLRHSGAKLLVGEDDRILGAHILGPHAEEVINLFALAMRKNLKARDLQEAIYAFPSSTSDAISIL